MKNIKKDFYWFKNNPGYVYLDSAATTLKPHIVVSEINNYYEKMCTNPHNTDSEFSHLVHEKIFRTRNLLANLFNAKSDEIIFTSGATESINLVANALEKYVKLSDQIALNYFEHGSNILPWQKLSERTNAKIIYAKYEDYQINEKDIINTISKQTKILAFSNLSNLFGFKLDAKKIVEAARKINPEIIIILDATQFLPHFKIDVKNIDIDFMVCSAHKLLGPTGVGCLYMKEKWTKLLDPLRFGGSMNNEIFCDHFTYASGAFKFEGGTPNAAGIYAWQFAIEYLNKYGWNNIAKHERELKIYANKLFNEIPNIEYYSKNNDSGILLFNIKGVHCQDLATYLGNHHIIVRSGLSCAKLSASVTNMHGAVRASLYIYNTKNDIDQLVDLLKKYKKGAELDNVING